MIAVPVAQPNLAWTCVSTQTKKNPLPNFYTPFDPPPVVYLHTKTAENFWHDNRWICDKGMILETMSPFKPIKT